jgi:hypothetical protein
METKTFIQNDSIILRKVGSFFFLIDINERNYGENFPLQKINETGVMLWNLFEKGNTYKNTFDGLKFYLEDAYSEKAIKDNLDSFLNYLLDINYIKIRENV